eukprot:CAMPEP_0171475152 /NCGR_PEP_ID=MMETSP0946-20130122/2836_1 /TAXON_ID=109269 /ORGANISM="Vaucheria litorea, Strain CCMP2940" /LENGTH=273 /DNA_ID=CAMNT_0012005191 /DNA_START=1103 /DNA_END=1924 /DNA_ORIENTATION=+
MGNNEKAISSLERTLQLSPSLSSARYLLASMKWQNGSKIQIEEKDKLAHFRDLFDFYAPSYDDHMRNSLLYTGPRLLRSIVRKATNATFSDFDEYTQKSYNYDVLNYLNSSLTILDLGCGTGLCGSWFKDYSNRMVGVDISQTMIDMATKKGCYDKLVQDDMTHYLYSEAKNYYDLVVAGESLQYIGDLYQVFKEVFRVLKQNGFFSLVVPMSTKNESFELNSEGTYAFGLKYMENLATNVGFQIYYIQSISSRIDKGVPLPGILAVFKKTQK